MRPYLVYFGSPGDQMYSKQKKKNYVIESKGNINSIFEKFIEITKILFE